MKLKFLDKPNMDNKWKPAADCVACHNGCCGTNTNKSRDEQIEKGKLDEFLDEVIATPKLGS